MDQVNQGESSGGLSTYPAKRKRGRPRKDSSLIVAGAAHVPPGFEIRGQNPHRANGTGEGNFEVGSTVTGVVEATFDAGYMINVRIGESPTNLRGIVFKPGHVAPVTAQNDVARQLPMIRRHDVCPPAPAAPTAGTVPPKHRRALPQIASSVPPVGVRGTVVPVVLQPVNFLNESNPKSSDSPQPAMMAFGDKDVHAVEPLAMLPPDHCIPASQICQGTQSQTSHQTNKKPCNEGASNENIKPVESTDIDNSSGTSDIQTGNSKEALKSLSEKSGTAPKQETVDVNKPTSTKFFPSASVPQALFNFGTGRMTQLLQAVQENLKDNQAQTDGRSQV